MVATEKEFKEFNTYFRRLLDYELDQMMDGEIKNARSKGIPKA